MGKSYGRKRGGKKTYKKRTLKRKSKYNSKKLAGLASKVAKFGDYPVVANSLKHGGLPAGAIVSALENGNVVIRHKEYIMDIDPTLLFVVQRELPLNPGMRQSFPWLSGIAKNFEQYDWKGLCFEYKSTSSDSVLSGAGSTSLGSVNMATQYNVLSDPFQTKRELLNYDFANSAKPSVSFIHPVDCKNGSGPLDRLWIRSEETPTAGSDRRLYDAGDFAIATEGCQGAAAAGSIGELWVTFEVELSKAKLDPATGKADHFRCFAGPTVAAPFGLLAVQEVDPENSLHGTLNATGTTYTWPVWVTEGTYMITWHCEGSSAVTYNWPAVPTLVNATMVNLFANQAGPPADGVNANAGQDAGTSMTEIHAQYMVKLGPNTVTGPSTFTLVPNASGVPTGNTCMDLFIVRMPQFEPFV